MALHDSPQRAWTEAPRVAICVITYRRPHGLERLLEGLDRLEFSGERPDLRIVVIDNDAAESARPVCDGARTWLDLPLVYGVEKRRGIPQARNAAIAAAGDWAEWVAFLDDDEFPSPAWLDELLWAAAAYDAPVVTGPTQPHFLAEPPEWITAGGFFDRPSHRAGERLTEAFTGNVLIASRVLAGLPTWFDEKMALGGGEDVEFFRRVSAAGYTIVWSEAAIAYECVPASRLTLRWLLQRHFRFGAVAVELERRAGWGRLGAGWALLRGGWCIAKGLVSALAASWRDRRAAVRALMLVAVGAGRVWAFWGFSYREYRRTHGT